MNEQEELSDAIINFQVKHHVNDTDLAFASHLSVEKVHAMKTGDGRFTAEEVNQLYDYMSANAQLISYLRKGFISNSNEAFFHALNFYNPQ